MTNPHFSPRRSLARLLAASLMAASMVSPLAAAEPAGELAAATTPGAAPSQGAAPSEGLTDAVKKASAEKPAGKIAGPGVSAAVEAAILKGMQQLMAANAGMTLMPQLAVLSEGARGGVKYLPCHTPQPARDVILVYRPGSPLRVRYERIAEAISNSVKPLLD